MSRRARHVAAPSNDPGALRTLVLAVSVLEDVDVDLAVDGVLWHGTCGLPMTWHDIKTAIGDADPNSPLARTRLLDLVRATLTIDQMGASAPREVTARARLLALPPDHVLHPGTTWVQQRMASGCLDAGVGITGLSEDPEAVIPLTSAVAKAAGVVPSQLWPSLLDQAEAMAAIAIERLERDKHDAQPVLRPVGGIDVPSLLFSTAMRRYLASSDGAGMRAVAVPQRSRGWLDPARIDPLFIGTAWSATDEPERGLPFPLLVTVDEVRLQVTRVGARAQAMNEADSHFPPYRPAGPPRAL